MRKKILVPTPETDGMVGHAPAIRIPVLGRSLVAPWGTIRGLGLGPLAGLQGDPPSWATAILSYLFIANTAIAVLVGEITTADRGSFFCFAPMSGSLDYGAAWRTLYFEWHDGCRTNGVAVSPTLVSASMTLAVLGLADV